GVRPDGRLTGPFLSSEITAQYLVIMQFLILHEFWHTESRWFRRGLLALGAANLACLVATGSRGEFLLLIGGMGVYLWLFRHRLGVVRAVKFLISGVIALTATGLIVVNFTLFGVLFERLKETEFNEQGVPDSREVLWAEAWPRVLERPMTGHGPRLRF